MRKHLGFKLSVCDIRSQISILATQPSAFVGKYLKGRFAVLANNSVRPSIYKYKFCGEEKTGEPTKSLEHENCFDVFPVSRHFGPQRR